MTHLSLFRLLQQNTRDWVAYRSLFSRLGSPRLRKGWLQWLLRAYFLFTDGVFLLYPHTVKRQENSWLSGIPLIRTLTPSLRAPPSHLITSQWPFFQIPSCWGLGFHPYSKHSDHSKRSGNFFCRRVFPN